MIVARIVLSWDTCTTQWHWSIPGARSDHSFGDWQEAAADARKKLGDITIEEPTLQYALEFAKKYHKPVFFGEEMYHYYNKEGMKEIDDLLHSLS